MEKNFLLEKVDNAISKYEFMLLKNNMDIKNIDNLFEQYHKKILDIIGREIYNDKNIVAKKNINDENESLLTEVPQNIKDKISVSVIDRILSFYNKTIDVYFNTNTLESLKKIERSMFKDIDNNLAYYWFPDTVEELICNLKDLYYKEKLQINLEEEELVVKVLENRQFMSRLILEEDLYIYALWIDSIYWRGIITDNIPLENTFICALPKLIYQQEKDVGSFNNDEIVYSLRYYYMYIFSKEENIYLSDEIIEMIFDSIYTMYFLLAMRIIHEPQDEIKEMCTFLLSKVDSSIKNKVKEKAIKVLEYDIEPIRETIEIINNL